MPRLDELPPTLVMQVLLLKIMPGYMKTGRGLHLEAITHAKNGCDIGMLLEDDRFWQVAGAVETHLDLVHVVLEGAVRFLALSKFEHRAADWHPLWDELMQEAAVISFHAESLEPIGTDCLQHTKTLE